MLVLVVVAMIVIAAVAVVAFPRAGGHRLPGGRARAARRPVASGRRERARWADRRRPIDERVLLAEGEEIQERVEARLSARGVAPQRLSGPNPPTVAERLAPQALANQAQAPGSARGIGAYGAPGRRRRHAQPPVDTEFPEFPQPPAPIVARTGEPLYAAPGFRPADGAAYPEADPLVPPGEPGYPDGRLVGGRRRPIGSRWSARKFR
jgi:hypothetical protein